MAKIVESKLIHCAHCKQVTKHYRNNSKMGLLGFLVNAALTIVTAGLWLLVVLVVMLLSVKIGGWTCSKCGAK